MHHCRAVRAHRRDSEPVREAQAQAAVDELEVADEVGRFRVGGNLATRVIQPEARTLPGEPLHADALAKIMVKDAESPDWGKRVMPRPDSFKAKFSTPVMADDMMKLYRHLLSL